MTLRVRILLIRARSPSRLKGGLVCGQGWVEFVEEILYFELHIVYRPFVSSFSFTLERILNRNLYCSRLWEGRWCDLECTMGYKICTGLDRTVKRLQNNNSANNFENGDTIFEVCTMPVRSSDVYADERNILRVLILL